MAVIGVLLTGRMSAMLQRALLRQKTMLSSTVCASANPLWRSQLLVGADCAEHLCPA